MSARAILNGVDATRLASLRYLNLFRLILAAVFVVFGRMLSLGGEFPSVFLATSIIYLVAVLALGFPDAVRRIGLDRIITLQVLIDVVALVIIMATSGGYRSGIPMLLMVVVAGAGLVGEGRMVLFYAALATVAVLLETLLRALSGAGNVDFLIVGIVGTGFFGVALAARLLARRALTNESLAISRGAALAQQQAINEHIVHDMQDGVLVADAEGRVLLLNPRAKALFGGTLREGAPVTADIAILGSGAPGGGDAGGVAVIQSPSGHPVRCHAVDAGEGGNRIYYFTDVEEVQRRAQQIKLAALGRLTASIAHEIRNPLSAVTHAAELLKDEKRGDMQARLIRIINDNSARIEQLVRDVLALGRRDKAMAETLNLGAFVESFLDEFALHGEAERSVFDVHVPEELTLVMDRAHLNQICWNLFANARRYCSGGRGAIRVWAETVGESRVALYVVDDGPGIDAATRTHLFEPFFTTHPKGTGLGLYIARELAEANEVQLEVLDAEPGAHFRLTGKRRP